MAWRSLVTTCKGIIPGTLYYCSRVQAGMILRRSRKAEPGCRTITCYEPNTASEQRCVGEKLVKMGLVQGETQLDPFYLDGWMDWVV